QNGRELLKFLEFDEIKKHQIIDNCFTHSTICIKRNIFRKYGLYDESYLYGQDYEIWCRLIYRDNLKAKNLSEKLVFMNIPIEKLINKNKTKFIKQCKNRIKTKLKYVKYSKNKLQCMISIYKNLIQLFFVYIFNKNN
ncbi:unnamed protein product, partial [marine sediment metagenome]